jgi:hypothetical protein
MSKYAINVITYLLFIAEAFDSLILEFGHDPRLAHAEWDALEIEHTCAVELLTEDEYLQFVDLLDAR